jgi:hypothetical protein
MGQRWWVRGFFSTVVTATLLMALLTGAASGERASTTFATSGASGAAGLAPVCHYTVRFNNSPVRENPDTNSVVRKHKQAGQGVTANWPCEIVVDPESGVAFAEVVCSCATDGQGWMRKDHLRAS